MRSTIGAALALIAATALAQERCDAPSPTIFCNTTEILQYKTQDCRPFHVFVTRGSDEPYPGRLGNLTKEICSAIGGEDCGYEDVEFPAKSTAWGTDEWCKSAGKGASNGQAQMKAFSKKCPNSKLILLGFSQGASVAQDILGGGGGQVFACEQDVNPALDASSAPGSNIIAAATFGAVIRSRDQNFTIGDGVNFDGRRARTPEQLKGLNQYSNVLRDYCHFGDPMCAVGSTPEDVYVHLNYFFEHNAEVTKWVADQAKASKDGKATPAQSGSTGNTNSSENGSTGSASALMVYNGHKTILASFGLAIIPLVLW